jgi:hypothetical protein
MKVRVGCFGRIAMLSVQIVGQQEQARVVLVSAPYALKAEDTETIGGSPPSAFVLAAPGTKNAAANETSHNSIRGPVDGSGHGSANAASLGSLDVTTTGGP